MMVLAFLQRRILFIYWLVLFVHCCFIKLGWPYIAITKPMFVPLLLAYLLVRDNHIGRTPGKFIFYVGLFLALFGDILMISVNNTFFLSGMIIFMIMNLCYAFSFFQLAEMKVYDPLALAVTTFILYVIGFCFYEAMKTDLGDYGPPVVVYMFMVSVMVLTAVNLARGGRLREAGARYILPGAVIFLVENMLVAAGTFHYGGDRNIYVTVIITYAVAQFLFMKGIEKAYLQHPQEYLVSDSRY
ncbi:MAG: lysoplasmalogenase [Chitinophagaceae bacterium]|nr:lysoplasmalogenase [Chitinophagaceae bacterium]